ncbi:MAG: acyl-CoA-binding protein [Flavobacteriaceae bacterium]|jgi:diazepam-binding inhibitor (GABA receptor modulating acyl-CoA-binding protein)
MNALKEHFEQSVERINNYSDPIPPDTLLRLYALYKRATNNRQGPGSKMPIINAFKLNAMLQLGRISPKKAMKEYVKEAKGLLGD